MATKWIKRVAPVLAALALVAQGNVSLAARSTSTTTTLTKAQIVDGMTVDQNLILSQKDGFGTESANAYQVYGDLTLNMQPGGCNNHVTDTADGEPVVEFDGSLKAQNIKTRLRIQTSAKADAGQTKDFWAGSTDVDLNLGFGDDGITFEKKGVYPSGDMGGVGGNPWIYVRFKNAQGEYTGTNDGWILVGRCVQGGDPAGIVQALNLPGRRFLRMTSSSCTTMGSSMSMRHRGGPRLKGQVAFANQRVANPTLATHYDNGNNFNEATVALTFHFTPEALDWAGADDVDLYSETADRWTGGNPAFGVRFGMYGDHGQFLGFSPTTLMMGRCKDLVGVEGDVDWTY